MRGRELLEAIEYIDDELVEESADVYAKQKKQRFRAVNRYRTGSAAACILILGAISIYAFQQNKKYEMSTESEISEDTTAGNAEEMENTVGFAVDSAYDEAAEESYTLIDDFPPKEMASTEAKESVACYKAPEKGDKIMGVMLKQAIEYYEKTDGIYRYHVSIEVFGDRPDNNGDGTYYYNELRVSEVGHEMLAAECERLQELGYKVELSDRYVLTGQLTAQEIENFDGLAEYGYMLLLVSE